MVQVIDWDKSERGPQRRKTASGALLHCCCICGTLEPWGPAWSHYSSIKQEDDCAPLPKFCSEKCRREGGEKARTVTEAMKRKAKDAEWRDPILVVREATDREKYRMARAEQAAALKSKARPKGTDING